MKIVDDNLVWMYEPSTTGTNKDVETIITGDTDSDYVKVVRCKDCKFYDSKRTAGLNGYCEVCRCYKEAYGFCDCGERKN